MNTKLITSLATTAVAGAFAVSLFAAPPHDGGEGDAHPRGASQRHAQSHHGEHAKNKRGSDHAERGDHGKKGRGGDRLDRMMEKHDLTDAQVTAIRAERDARAKQAQALRDDIVNAQRKLRALGKEMRDAVASHLTDEQKAAMAAHQDGKRRGGERAGKRGGKRGGDQEKTPDAA